MLAESWGVGQVLWSMIWFALFVIWIAILIHVFVDIFRSHDLGGFAKTLWVLFVIVMPYLGVFVYLIARGGKMSQHDFDAAQARENQMREYIQSTTGSAGSASAELERLAGLKEQGVIDDAEFQRLKAKVVSS